MSAQIISADRWRAAAARRTKREWEISQAEKKAAAPKRLTLDDILGVDEPWGGGHAA